jgi:3-dehydroquinate synthase
MSAHQGTIGGGLSETLTVELAARSYDIAIGSGSMSGLGERLRRLGIKGRIAVISNPTVDALYGAVVMDSLKSAALDAVGVIVPDGEEYKSFETYSYIMGELLRHKLDRRSALVALGGGVIGDMTGFAASTYMRGIGCVQVPTTLLAQVDSSVGGKTGINHPLGKNMIGTFYQPLLVWCDIDTLKTLPRREIRAGIAEIIKYGVIWDKGTSKEGLFEFLTDNRDAALALEPKTLADLIRHSCRIKAEVVSADEREAGPRAILNFGHTIGHAVETLTGYTQYLHGEAVAIGMCMEARLSAAMGIMTQTDAQRISSLVKSYGLPWEMPAGLSAAAVIEAVRMDKKAEGGSITVVLPERIGSVIIGKDVPEKSLRALLM